MRIALIGAGRIAQSHAEALRGFPEHTIAAFADLNLEVARSMADKHGGEAFADYRDLLARADCDAVVVGVPHCLHREVAVAAFEVGKHVLLEKPMACTVEECDAIIEAGKRARRTLMVGYTHHFMPLIIEARRLIHEGRLGKLVMGLDFMAYGQVEPEAERKIRWLLRRDAAGGGTVMNMGSHSLARIMFMTGQQITAVYAACGNERPDLTHIDIELHMLGMLHLSGGGVIGLWQDAYGQRNEIKNEFTGTAGALVFPTYGNTLTLYHEGQAEAIEAGGPSPWWSEWQEFSSAIAQDREPSVSGPFGRRVIEVAQALYQSAAERRRVELPAAAGLVL